MPVANTQTSDYYPLSDQNKGIVRRETIWPGSAAGNPIHMVTTQTPGNPIDMADFKEFSLKVIHSKPRVNQTQHNAGQEWRTRMEKQIKLMEQKQLDLEDEIKRLKRLVAQRPDISQTQEKLVQLEHRVRNFESQLQDQLRILEGPLAEMKNLEKRIQTLEARQCEKIQVTNSLVQRETSLSTLETIQRLINSAMEREFTHERMLPYLMPHLKSQLKTEMVEALMGKLEPRLLDSLPGKLTVKSEMVDVLMVKVEPRLLGSLSGKLGTNTETVEALFKELETRLLCSLPSKLTNKVAIHQQSSHTSNDTTSSTSVFSLFMVLFLFVGFLLLMGYVHGPVRLFDCSASKCHFV